MRMASDQNLNYGLFPQSFCNQHVVSFQSGVANTASLGMVPIPANDSIEGSSRVGGMPGILNASCSMVVPMNSNVIGTSSMIGTSDMSHMSNSTGLAVDPLHLKYGFSISVEWSQHELAVLREGLARHANDTSIMKYIKIAARLPEKTVRDVAMRCQWMMKRDSAKRRKAEECYAGRKMKDTKELAVESTLWATNYPENSASHSFTGNNTKYTNQVSCGVSEFDCAMRQVLEENNQLLTQIATNIAASQAQSNIELFDRTRKNIIIMLQSMSQMPGVMSSMPPLPISVDERLANYVLPNVSLANFPGATNRLNDELRGW